MIENLIIVSILVGIISGLFITIYGVFTEYLSMILFLGDPMETIPNLPIWYIYLIPMVSIFIVNYLIIKYPSIREYGVSEISEAIEQNKLVFGLKELFFKIFASSLSIASGFAIGNEGPSAAIGAMIASKIHTFKKLPKELLKISISVGASSGIAAIFVSPITGIVFAIENIAYEFIKNYVGYLILASVLAFSISVQFLEPLIFNYISGKSLDYRYLIATILFIPVMTFFVYFYLGLKNKVLKFLNEKLNRFEKYRAFIFAFIGGGVIGTIMLISPYAVFSGHEVVKILINDKLHLSLITIFIIIVLRIIATSVSLYANAIGGIFIALMSIGALIGYGFAEMSNYLFQLEIEPFYYAAIGSAVFMGVNMKLPLTAIILALEITYDYNVIVPTGISVVIITYLASLNFNIKKYKGIK